jgi:hypothetical protein
MDLNEFAQWLKNTAATEREIEKKLRKDHPQGPDGPALRSAPDWWAGRASAFEDALKMLEPILRKMAERECAKTTLTA